MSKYIIVVIIVLIAVVFIIYNFFTYFLGISGTRSSFQSDKDEFTTYLKGVELAPWNLQELEILSRNGRADVDEGILSRTEKGFINSIYEEPLLAYAVKEYRSTAKKSISIRIKDKIFNYELKGKKLFVSEGHQEIGQIEIKKGLEYINENDRYSIDILETTSWVPGRVNGDQLFSVRKFEGSETEGGRVIQVLGKFTNEQASSFLILLAFAIVDEQI